MSISVIGISAQEQERAAFVAAQKALPASTGMRVYGRTEDLFSDLEQVKPGDTQVVLIGAHIEELAQLNLVDAVRNLFSHAPIIVVLPARDSDMVNRAMLAGASAALAMNWNEQDLASMVRRVTKASKGTKHLGPASQNQFQNIQKNILSFVSAKGGAGKSTLCALCAYRLSLAGISVAVVDFDLQFGDMRFVFNASPEKTLFDLLECLDSPALPARHFGVQISENLTLFLPEQAPEKAELFYGKVSSLLQRIAQEFDVVLVNTGSFWTLLHIELIEASSQVVCLTDQGIISSRATQSLMAMCTKLNLPVRQFIYLVNKVQAYGLSSNDICQALGIREALNLKYFERDFSMLMDVGNVSEAFALIEKQDSFESIVHTISHKMGLQVNGVQAIQTAMKKSPWRWFK